MTYRCQISWLFSSFHLLGVEKVCVEWMMSSTKHKSESRKSHHQPNNNHEKTKGSRNKYETYRSYRMFDRFPHRWGYLDKKKTTYTAGFEQIWSLRNKRVYAKLNAYEIMRTKKIDHEGCNKNCMYTDFLVCIHAVLISMCEMKIQLPCKFQMRWS